MRYKLMFILVLLSMILIACQEPSAELIQLTLNPGVDTIEIGTSYQDPGAKAKYGVLDLEVEVISNSLDIETIGTYEIIYEARHQTFIKRVKRILVVVDTTPPNLYLNPGIDTIKIGKTWIDEGVIAEDLSGILEVTQSGAVLNSIGTYIITYTATDLYGNESSIQRVVHVIE